MLDMTEERATVAEDGYDRFRGLTREQIHALLEIDERERTGSGLKGCHEVAAAYEDAGIPFTADCALHYAREKEAAERHGLAIAWYKYWAMYGERDTAEAARRKDGFKAYLIRHGLINNIHTLEFACTTEEWRSAANAALAKRSIFLGMASEVSAREVLGIFVRIKDHRGIRAFLKKALRHADKDDALAVAAARALGRSLTIRERERIARRLLRSSANISDAFAYIRKHGLRSLYRPFIEAAVRNSYVPYSTVSRWAKALRTPLRISDLKHGFTMRRASEDTRIISDAVAFAEALAQRSAYWRTRLPGIYEWARNVYLEYYDPRSADQYGQRCGKPLTPEELIAVVHRLADRTWDDVRASVNREYCLCLAAQRIADAIGAPPDRPVTRAAAAA